MRNRSPDEAKRNPGSFNCRKTNPDFASLHPGYAFSFFHMIVVSQMRPSGNSA
jgi:hypothetical protein